MTGLVCFGIRCAGWLDLKPGSMPVMLKYVQRTLSPLEFHCKDSLGNGGRT